jgi:hypothetical protein
MSWHFVAPTHWSCFEDHLQFLPIFVHLEPYEIWIHKFLLCNVFNMFTFDDCTHFIVLQFCLALLSTIIVLRSSFWDLAFFDTICCIYCKLIHLCLVFVGVCKKEQKKVESGRRCKARDLESCRRFVEHTSPFLNDEVGEALIVYFLWILVITCECQ